MALTEQQYILLTFIEQEYSITGLFPTQERCSEETGLSDQFVRQALTSKEFNKGLEVRGIKKPNTDGVGTKVVTPEQMAAISTILDRNDTRSDKKKLADLGIPTQTWQMWLRDPAFKSYYNKRAESLFGDMLSEAPRALADNVSRGDISSIKLVYEMTGRWSDKRRDDLPIDFILAKVVEVLQKYITDPAALTAAAEELAVFTAPPALPPAGPADVLPVLEGVPGRPDHKTIVSEPSEYSNLSGI